MAKWRCLHNTVSLSIALNEASAHDALFYTWGIAHTDAWGLLRQDQAKGMVFPQRSTRAKVATAIERLIEMKKLCVQHGAGYDWLHWCHFEKYQGEITRRHRPAPPFAFICPNENGEHLRTAAITADHDRPTVPYRTVHHKTTTPPTPPVGAPSPSRLMQAVMAIWPGAGAVYFQGYTDLEEEYGSDFMWGCWKAALESGQTKPSVRYLEAIARRCKAEGREPNERQELRDEPKEQPDNRPTEIGGIPVIGWAAGLPILDAGAKAP